LLLLLLIYLLIPREPYYYGHQYVVFMLSSAVNTSGLYLLAFYCVMLCIEHMCCRTVSVCPSIHHNLVLNQNDLIYCQNSLNT